MIIALVIYWIVCGVATELVTEPLNGAPVLGFIASMMVGGIYIPARVIARVAR